MNPLSGSQKEVNGGVHVFNAEMRRPRQAAERAERETAGRRGTRGRARGRALGDTRAERATGVSVARIGGDTRAQRQPRSRGRQWHCVAGTGSREQGGGFRNRQNRRTLQGFSIVGQTRVSVVLFLWFFSTRIFLFFFFRITRRTSRGAAQWRP